MRTCTKIATFSLLLLNATLFSNAQAINNQDTQAPTIDAITDNVDDKVKGTKDGDYGLHSYSDTKTITVSDNQQLLTLAIACERKNGESSVPIALQAFGIDGKEATKTISFKALNIDCQQNSIIKVIDVNGNETVEVIPWF